MTESPRTLQERLLHALTTAQNDDLSAPGTQKRARHIERDEAIRDAIDALAEAREALEPFAKAAAKYGETWADQMTARESGIKVRDCRNARAVHAKLKAASGGEG